MLFAPKEKGQGLVEYALILCIGCHCCNCSLDDFGSCHRQRVQQNQQQPFRRLVSIAHNV